MKLTRLSRDTLLLLLSNGGGALLLFALSALIGRGLGSAGLGVYAFALAWVYPLGLLVEFGLTTLMLRDTGANRALLPVYMDALTRARLMIGGALMIAFYALAPLINRDPAVVIGLQVSAPLLIVQPFYSQFTTVFRLIGAVWTIPALNLGMIAAQVALTAISLTHGGDVIHALILNTVTSAGQLIAAWLLYRWYANRLRAPIPAEHPRIVNLKLAPLLRAALPFALAGIFAALITRVPAVMLGMLTTTAQVGYFNAASRLVEAARLVPNAFFGAYFPALAQTTAQPARLRRAFIRANFALGAFGVIVALIFSFYRTPLITLVYGADFGTAEGVLLILGWSLIFFAVGGTQTLYLYARQREVAVSSVNGTLVLIQIGLCWGLVQVAGAVGAASAVLITQIMGAIMLFQHNRDPVTDS